MTTSKVFVHTEKTKPNKNTKMKTKKKDNKTKRKIQNITVIKYNITYKIKIQSRYNQDDEDPA